MIKSMTGFGRYEVQEDARKFCVELKGVNHKYLEVGIRMPKQLNCFESAIRDLLKAYAVRGKIDIFITYENLESGEFSLRYNQCLAEEYVKCFEEMARNFGIENDMRASTLARLPEVITMKELTEDEGRLWEALEKALKGAFEKFVGTRIKEGENLRRDILCKLSKIEEIVAYIEKRSPEIVDEYCKRISDKAAELLGDRQIEESRLAEEIILFSDKICTDEEVVRLKSHIAHMKDTLEDSESAGRKLDFIAQEMNRETNTILSKANDREVSNCAISLKTEIEKIREQIQNIE